MRQFLAFLSHHLLVNGLLVLVGLRLFTVLFYKYWKREDLIKAMTTGWKEVKEPPSSHSEIKPALAGFSS